MAEDDKPSLDLPALAYKLRTLHEGTPEREAYLQRLREQVRSGTYQVDSEKLAERLISELGVDKGDV